MTYMYTRSDAEKIAKQNKTLKIVIVILLFTCAIAIIIAHNYKVQLRMNEYAMMNDCEWHYSYYLNEEPICK